MVRLSEDAEALELRVAWAEAIEEDRRRAHVGSTSSPHLFRNRTGELSRNGTADPHEHWDNGPESGPTAAPLEVEEDLEEEQDQEQDQEPEPHPAPYAAGRTGAGEAEGFDSDLVEQVWSILSEALDWLGLNDYGREWPRPKRETILQALAEHKPDHVRARNAALETKRIVQEQNRAPNIAGLYAAKLAEVVGVRDEARASLAAAREAAS